MKKTRWCKRVQDAWGFNLADVSYVVKKAAMSECKKF